jgi:hypothetical protein
MAESPSTLREQKRAARFEAFRTNIPNVKDVRAREEELTARDIYQTALAKGASEEEAARKMVGSGIGQVAPNIERQKYEQYRREQDPTSGAYLVKMREQNKLREKLAADIDKSIGFGENSALRTAAGYERALNRARAAGLSEDELKARIGRAEKSQEPAAKETKEGTQTPIEMVGPPTTLRNQETATQTSVEMVGPPKPTTTSNKRGQTRKEEEVVIEAVQPRNVASDALKTFGVLAAERTGLLNAYDLARSPSAALSAYQRAAESEAALQTSQRRKEQIDRLLREERPQYDLTSEQVRALSPEERQARARYLASLRGRVTVK